MREISNDIYSISRLMYEWMVQGLLYASLYNLYKMYAIELVGGKFIGLVTEYFKLLLWAVYYYYYYFFLPIWKHSDARFSFSDVFEYKCGQ